MYTPPVFPAPDGRYVLEISPVSMRMSHEVNVPLLLETQSKTYLFDPGSLWDASEVTWSENSRYLTMQMRHYDNGLRVFELALDVESQTAVLTFDGHTMASGSFSSVQKAMGKMDDIVRLVRSL